MQQSQKWYNQIPLAVQTVLYCIQMQTEVTPPITSSLGSNPGLCFWIKKNILKQNNIQKHIFK